MRAVFVLFIVCALPLAACDANPSGGDPTPAVVEARTVHFVVSGMTCEGCEMAITQALLQEEGISEAGADHKAGSAWARLEPGAADPTALAAVISTLGYQASQAVTEP